ncbi:MAG: tRNA uridine-5-carboxymethylaminomethyl(34) synthesis GTPase MnmE [Nitrospirae bacterium]|nr:tRNA uridine-5-carboxymethylaminomethyl(34) synthesis GTPase MnmE [Nitrospirota bacterium]
MVIQEDTVCAIVTPQGIGGISVIRLSGKDAIAIASGLFRTKSGKSLTEAITHTIHYGFIIDPVSGEKADEVMVSVMRSPNSFTCEDVVEISCHGGLLITSKILEIFIKSGARLSEPGEFTKRAFLNGRIDLTQAEAVIDVINAKTEEGIRSAINQLEGKLSKEINMLNDEVVSVLANIEAFIDFPEDELDIPVDALTNRISFVKNRIENLIEGYYRLRPFREGVLTAIVGRTNVGKSSLLNTLLGEERAIVTPHPGTTRDIIDGTVNINGILLRLLDTAGLRTTIDAAEEEGIKRMYKTIDTAELVLLILDGSEPLTEEDKNIIEYTQNKKRVVVINKIDKGNVLAKVPDIKNSTLVQTSVIKEESIDELRQIIKQTITGIDTGKTAETFVTNLRHKNALESAKKECEKFTEASEERLPLEIQALHLRKAVDLFGEITGVVTTEDILNKIFSEFCIGK